MRAPAVSFVRKLMLAAVVGLLACSLVPLGSAFAEGEGEAGPAVDSPQEVSAEQVDEGSGVAPMLASGLVGNPSTFINSDVALDSEPVIGSFTVDGLTFAVTEGFDVELVGVSPDWQQVPGSQEGDGSPVAPMLASGPDGSDADSSKLALPESITYEGVDYAVTSIGAYALYLSGVASVELPASVAQVDDRAFRSSDVAAVEVTDGNPFYSSFDGALYDAAQLSLLLIPEGKQGTVLLPKTAEVAPPSVFSHCSLVQAIAVEEGSAAFASENDLLYDASLTTLLRVPAGATDIVIRDGCTTIAAGALEACASLATITAPASVTSISPDVFTLVPTVCLPASALAEDALQLSALVALSSSADDLLEVDPSAVTVTAQGAADSWTALGFDVDSDAIPSDASAAIFEGNFPDAKTDELPIADVSSAAAYESTPVVAKLTIVSPAGSLNYRSYSSFNTTTSTGPLIDSGVVPSNWTIDYYAVCSWATYKDASERTGDSLIMTQTTSAWNGRCCWITNANPGYTLKWTRSGGMADIIGSSATDYHLSGETTITVTQIPKTFTFTWDSQGGSTVANTSATYSSTAKVPMPSTEPKRDHYRFLGWYTAPSGGSLVTSATALPADNATYYAQWASTLVTVTWDANGGSAVAPTVQDQGDPLQMPANPTRDGYTFVGWFTERDGGSQVLTTSVVPQANATYYARWIQRDSSARLNVRSASGGYRQVSYSDGSQSVVATISTNYTPMFVPERLCLAGGQLQAIGAYSDLTNPRLGELHVGVNEALTGVTSAWVVATDDAGTKHAFELGSDWVWLSAYSGTTIVYLNGCTTYKVTWNANGGTVSPASTSGVLPYAAVTAPVPAVRAGYAFVGWYDSTGAYVCAGGESTPPVSGNVTYTAHWVGIGARVITYSDTGFIFRQVAYDDGAISVVAEYSAATGAPYTATLVADAIRLSAGQVQQTGYLPGEVTGRAGELFVGTSASASKDIGGVQRAWLVTSDPVMGSRGMLLGSGWTSLVGCTSARLYLNEWPSCTITWDAAGGVVAPTSTTGLAPYEAATSPEPTWVGHDLLGWYDTAGKRVCGAGEEVRVGASTRYIAHWSAHVYTIVFDPHGEGAQVDPQSIKATYGEAVALPLPTRPGFAFLGWTTEEDGAGERFEAVVPVVPGLADEDGATVTLYAQWTPVISADVPIEVTASVDLLGVEDQAPASGYIESRCGAPLAVEQVSFTALAGAAELFGEANTASVSLQALALEGDASWEASAPTFSFPLSGDATEADPSKLAAFRMGAYEERIPISYRFAIPEDVLAAIDQARFEGVTTPVCSVVYKVALAQPAS